MTTQESHWRRNLSLILAGLVHALCFAPGPLPSLALPFIELFSLSVLAYAVFTSNSVRRAACSAFLFGLGNFILGLYWIFISLHDYGGLAAPMAGAAVVILAAFEALFMTLAAAVTRWLAAPGLPVPSGRCRHLLTAAVWASAWTGAEWLRGTLFTGFPWLNIGYAHIEGVLAPWAPIVGVYGVAWLAAFGAGAIALFAAAKDSSGDTTAAVTLGVAILCGLAGIVLGHVDWSQPYGKPIIVRLVQGNVPQSEKFNPRLLWQGLGTYMKLAALPPKARDGVPGIVIMPETVLPIFQDQVAPEVWQQWIDLSSTTGASLVMGVPLHIRRGKDNRYTNSAIVVTPDSDAQRIISGAIAMHYDKHHLVPFGEFVPPGFRWFIDELNIPLGDFNRGASRQALFDLDGQRLAPDICYENAFGEEIIQSVRDSLRHGPGATILVNMSNLGWFGDSWALRQDLEISRMRALETARPMLMATNTGITAAISPQGVVRDQLPPMAPGVLDVEVQGRSGLTPYVRWGNAPVLIWTAILLLLGFVGLKGGKPVTTTPEASKPTPEAHGTSGT